MLNELPQHSSSEALLFKPCSLQNCVLFVPSEPEQVPAGYLRRDLWPFILKLSPNCTVYCLKWWFQAGWYNPKPEFRINFPSLDVYSEITEPLSQKRQNKKRLVLKPQDTKHTALRTVWEGPTPSSILNCFLFHLSLSTCNYTPAPFNQVFD